MTAAKNLSPEQKTENKRKAAAARHSTDTYIAAIVRRAKPLSEEQAAKLRPLLPGGASR